jgi:hypothetical protein
MGVQEVPSPKIKRKYKKLIYRQLLSIRRSRNTLLWFEAKETMMLSDCFPILSVFYFKKNREKNFLEGKRNVSHACFTTKRTKLHYSSIITKNCKTNWSRLTNPLLQFWTFYFHGLWTHYCSLSEYSSSAFVCSLLIMR